MDITGLKAAAIRDIDSLRPRLEKLSRSIHSNPETAFQEHGAAESLASFLEEQGFSVERGICDMPTAFRATAGSGSPVIAVLAEYDALPELGHACGHNLIATAAAGAGSALCRLVARLGGTVQVIGTPGEELTGGKAFMVERGAFAGIDAAMMVHMSNENAAAISSIACRTLDIEFFGKASHAAAAPEQGVNALEAMILSYNAIDSLRQHVRDDARIHGIITRGGEAPNIVPEYCAGAFIARAADDEYLADLEERVLNCFRSGALATGSRLEHRWADVRYSAMRSNMVMARLFRDNIQSLGRSMGFENETGSFSTDMGNVSHVLPGIHPLIAIAPPEILIHSPEFAKAALSEQGVKGMMDGAKAMAMTVIDLFASPQTLEDAKKEFALGK